MLFFSIYDERSYRGKPVSEQWRHQALVAFSARHSSIERSLEVGFSLILSIYKIHRYKRLVCQVCGMATRWRNFPSNLPKTKLHYAIKDS